MIEDIPKENVTVNASNIVKRITIMIVRYTKNNVAKKQSRKMIDMARI